MRRIIGTQSVPFFVMVRVTSLLVVLD
jgi:hypothetical protein